MLLRFTFNSFGLDIGSIRSGGTLTEAKNGPQNIEKLKKSINRLKFEELFLNQLGFLLSKTDRLEKIDGFKFKVVGNNFNKFYHKTLPFELTGDQKKVIKEIRKDFNSGKQMNRLLQGDVGSGKTIVSLMIILIAIMQGVL